MIELTDIKNMPYLKLSKRTKAALSDHFQDKEHNGSLVHSEYVVFEEINEDQFWTSLILPWGDEYGVIALVHSYVGKAGLLTHQQITETVGGTVSRHTSYLPYAANLIFYEQVRGLFSPEGLHVPEMTDQEVAKLRTLLTKDQLTEWEGNILDVQMKILQFNMKRLPTVETPVLLTLVTGNLGTLKLHMETVADAYAAIADMKGPGGFERMRAKGFIANLPNPKK